MFNSPILLQIGNTGFYFHCDIVADMRNQPKGSKSMSVWGLGCTNKRNGRIRVDKAAVSAAVFGSNTQVFALLPHPSKNYTRDQKFAWCFLLMAFRISGVWR
jgi:hypothetical protein